MTAGVFEITDDEGFLALVDPEAESDDDWIRRGVHFVVELTPDVAGPATWTAVPWAEL